MQYMFFYNEVDEFLLSGPSPVVPPGQPLRSRFCVRL
jgi:hypothetical protein